MSSGINAMRLLGALMILMLTPSLTGCARSPAEWAAFLRGDRAEVVVDKVCPPPLPRLPDSVADALDVAVDQDPKGAGSWVNRLADTYEFQDACAET